MNNQISQAIAAKVEEAAKVIEQQVDQEIEKLRNLDSDDIENIRQKRLADMQKRAKQEAEWRKLVMNSFGF